MARIRSIKSEEARLVRETNRLLKKVRAIPCDNVASTHDAMRVLVSLRKATYENMNQIQHACLILDSAKWLRKHVLLGREAAWLWHPKQTGGRDEPDLRCRTGSRVIVAEATASQVPLDERMRKTLAKLAKMKGARYYFVRTERVRRRAETKVSKRRWEINVVLLP